MTSFRETVSVVMPARNAASHISEAAKSVLSQEEVGELIVVDDGSSDGTADKVLSLGDPRVRVVPGPTNGVAASLNCGFAEARLPFTARCDADDLFETGRLQWQCERLSKLPDHVAVCAGYATITQSGKKIADLAIEGDERDVTEVLFDGSGITSFCTWLTRSSAIKKAGGARVWFKTAEDVDLQFRLAAIGQVWYVPKIAYRYRLHDASLTHSKAAGAKLRFFHEQATRFARQRQTTGTDDLIAGQPPIFTGSQADRAIPASLQIAGQLEGSAWNALENGQPATAIGQMVRAIRYEPLQMRRWRGIIILILRAFFKQSR